MKIIARYVVFRHFTPILGLSVAAFTGLYLAIDFFEKIDDFMEKKVSVAHTCAYFLYKIPSIATQGIPMAALLAALIGFGILKHNREIVALEAAGVKSSTYTRPVLLAALVLCLAHFGFGETIARTLNQRADRIWYGEVRQHKTSASWLHENVWYHGRNTIYQVRLYDRKSQNLEKVSLFYLDPQFKLMRRLDAKRLHWDGKGWVAEDGLILSFNGTNTQQEWFQELKLDLPETPGDFSSLETVPEELDWLSLLRYTRKIRQEGYDSTPYEIELHLRAASPATTLVLVLLGLLIALRQGPHTGIALGIGVAILLASVYLTVLQLGCSLATAGVLAPLAGVWSGNALFAALAGYLWMREQ
jgi:lipopolysaccharide export system permease protein